MDKKQGEKFIEAICVIIKFDGLSVTPQRVAITAQQLGYGCWVEGDCFVGLAFPDGTWAKYIV